MQRPPRRGGPADLQGIIVAREDEITLGADIGRGALGKVRRGRFRDVDVAVKTLHLLSTEPCDLLCMGGALQLHEREALEVELAKECRTLQRLVHTNILPFLAMGVSPAGRPVSLVSQLIEDGSLQQALYDPARSHLRGHDNLLPRASQLIVSRGIFSALEYMATIPILHRDIKPANVLTVLSSDGGRLEKVLLADFGAAKQTLSRSSTVSQAGTPVYMSPEIREATDAVGPKSDVFMAGVVMLEMCVGRQPSPGPEMRRVGRERVAVKEQDRRRADIELAERESRCTTPHLTLIHQCLHDFPEDRIDAAGASAALDAELQAIGGAAHGTNRRIRVQPILPADGGPLSIRVSARTTIHEIKEQISSQLAGLQVSDQTLLFAGRQLDDLHTVDDYNLLSQSMLHLRLDKNCQYSRALQQPVVVKSEQAGVQFDFGSSQEESGSAAGAATGAVVAGVSYGSAVALGASPLFALTGVCLPPLAVGAGLVIAGGAIGSALGSKSKSKQAQPAAEHRA